MPVFAIALLGPLLSIPQGAPVGNRCQSGPPALGSACVFSIAAPAAPSSTWKFTRTQGAKEGESFAAIMKTADTTQSDLDFAGLIVRCAPKGKIDVLVALIRPLPPRSRPQVTITSASGGSQTFEASMAGAGVAVLLPDEVAAFAGGKWQVTASLTVTVKEKESDSEIKGLVALNGLREAFNSLLTNCGQ
ncbi:hypothetical protein [Bradyrhizobium sp. UFLA05-112]